MLNAVWSRQEAIKFILVSYNHLRFICFSSLLSQVINLFYNSKLHSIFLNSQALNMFWEFILMAGNFNLDHPLNIECPSIPVFSFFLFRAHFKTECVLCWLPSPLCLHNIHYNILISISLKGTWDELPNRSFFFKLHSQTATIRVSVSN